MTSVARAVLWTVGGVSSVALATVLVFVALPAAFAPHREPGFGPISEAQARHDVRTSGLQLLGGLVLALGAVFSARTYVLHRGSQAIERERQITDRYSSAVALL